MSCTQTQVGNSLSAVLFCLLLGAHQEGKKKKGGGRGGMRDREENRERGGGKSSRNYALGKPGSMEPDSSGILCSQLSGVEIQSFLDGLAFFVSIAASPSIISVHKEAFDAYINH